MKKLLPFLSIAFAFAACTSKPAETEVKTVQTAAPATDTAGLAQFQQWKAQNELNVAAPIQQETAEAPAEPVKTVTVYRDRVVERPAPVRRQTTQKSQPRVSTPPQEKPEPVTGGGSSDVASNSGTSTSGTSSTPSTEPAAEKKEGWSKAAKGAAIGGAGGAVLGAIISKKNRAAGAVIGGVLGGAVGYGIGKSKDKKAAE